MTHVDSQQRVLFAVHAILQRAMGSRYVLFALSIHLALLTLLGGRVVLRTLLPPVPPKPVDARLLVPQTPNHPVPPQPRSVNTEPDRKRGDEVLRDTTRIETTDRVKDLIGTLRPTLGPPRDVFRSLSSPTTDRVIKDAGFRDGTLILDQKRLADVWGFQELWIDRKSWTGQGLPPSTFTCYLGKYADGDWNCNPTALENMLTQVGRWSKGRIQASVQPQPLDLASNEIYTIKPPFIFLTGHRDFHFTEQEVANLREYLLVGGTLWADNSMPGRHSRFDVAFRREMKRVFADREFEPVPRNHEIFSAFFRLKEVPTGMNWYQEPIEQVRILDESVVIYTQNAYSDLWETALNETNKIDTELYLDEDTSESYHKWGPHWGSYLTGFLYRNVTEQSIVEANQLALNIIVHLLTQYDDKFRMIGKL